MKEDELNFEQAGRKKKKPSSIINILLIVATFFTTSIAGVLWAGKDFTDLSNIHLGFAYAILIVTFLGAHEFGHYIASRVHKVDATLPFFIPFPPAPNLPSIFGTFGAVIKTYSPIRSRKALFDIGVAGPIAGFVVAFAFLIYGLSTLPGKEFIYNIHPEYLTEFGGKIPETSLHFGDTLLFWISAKLFANPDGFLPPMNEIYHYPFLNVGWFGLFVTTLNLIPIGQLDGGHVAYAMFGEEKQYKVANIAWKIMMAIGIVGLLGILYDFMSFDYPDKTYQFFKDLLLPPLKFIKAKVPWLLQCWPGWLFWGLIARFFIKLRHPPLIEHGEPLDSKRRAIGWCAFVILFLSLSYNGIYFIQ